MKIGSEVEGVRDERERKGVCCVQSAREMVRYKRKRDKASKNHGTVHQFMVLSRKIGVEMVPGWIARRSRMFVAW